MCYAVCYKYHDQDTQVYFTNPGAVLPVFNKNKQIQLIPWGRRHSQQGSLPVGGWAHLDAIYAGHWNRWFPVPVKLPVTQFLEKTVEDHSRWFDLMNGQCIQGLIAREKYEQRVYVVTITPELDNSLYQRWPRIILSP